MKHPTVDVVIYAHDHEAFIEECLTSVFQQSVTFPVHIRVHDDASEDSTSEILKKLSQESPFPMTITRAPQNRYQFGSRFKHEFLVGSTSKYLAVLDADDYWSSDQKLARQVLVMEENETIALCHHGYEVAKDGHVVETVASNDGDLVPGLKFADGNFVGTSTVMLRRKCVPERMPDGFNDPGGIDDWQIWALTAQNFQVGYLDTPMAVYRLHHGNHFANQQLAEKKYQTLRALIYLANSVDPAHQVFYTRALEKRITNRRTSMMGKLSELKEKLVPTIPAG